MAASHVSILFAQLIRLIAILLKFATQLMARSPIRRPKYPPAENRSIDLFGFILAAFPHTVCGLAGHFCAVAPFSCCFARETIRFILVSISNNADNSCYPDQIDYKMEYA